MEVNHVANVQQDESNVPMDQPGSAQVDHFEWPEIFFENDENYIFEDEAGTLNLNQLSETNEQIEEQPTPSKYLDEVVPIPAIPTRKFYKRKQSAAVLTSAENIQTLKQRKQDKLEKEDKKLEKLNMAKKYKKKPAKPEPKKHSQSEENKVECRCVECTENYYETRETVDWICCVSCLKWLHESCTMYNPMCNICGQKNKRDSVKKCLKID